MSNDLMIPDAADVPEYIMKPEFAKQANEDAAAGISTGFPARIKMSAKTFVLVDGNGEEKNFPIKKMVEDESTGIAYMPVVILRAKKALTKVWYASAYNPAEEGVAPDCFSNDAERPDSSVADPQSETCAACPQNAFGSGKDQNGNPTKGKACSDNKILAVYVPGFGVHSLKVAPASLKNFGLYVKQLSARGIPVGMVKTFIGFDPKADYSIMTFRFGSYLDKNVIPKLAEMSTSAEAEDIIGGQAFATKSLDASPKVAVPPKTPAPPEPEKEKAAAEPADDLGLGDAPVKEAAAESKAQKKDPEPEPSASDGAGISDDDLARELGL